MDIIKSIIVWITGLCFMVVLFPLTFLIWVLVLPFDKDRKIIHWILIYQSVLLSEIMPIWKIRVEGREKIRKGTTYVIISNHQSLLDILLINCIRCRFRWISKIENVRLPVLGWYIRMARYITVDRGNEESKNGMLENSFICLKNGISIMIFPEGTRSPDREISFFKRGAFQLALEAKVPILPVLIDGTGDILPKHGLIFGSDHRITIRVLDPVPPASFDAGSPEELALKFSTMMALELKELRDKNDLK